jgi:hypothetical protein
LQQEQPVPVRVLAPSLALQASGPTRRFLDRQATFTFQLQNSGSAAATNCEIVARLPAGLKFNFANNKGSYVPAEHAVYWSLPELPAGQPAAIELTVLPVEVGNQAVVIQATADLGARAEARAALAVESQGELAFTIQQDNDPIELSASTTFSVEIRNVGMRADKDVRLVAQLPPGSQVLRVDAPVKYAVQADQLVFEPIPQMDPRAAHIYRFEVRLGQVGTQVVRAQLTSQNRSTPVIKEEATDVYDDRR